MKKFIRLMSALLTAIMLLSGLTGLSMINVSAAEEELDAEQPQSVGRQLQQRGVGLIHKEGSQLPGKEKHQQKSESGDHGG